ncbi:hypothetical protein RYX36_024365 [Vicia faba]
MVDLSFYREPEEAKDQEEDDVHPQNMLLLISMQLFHLMVSDLLQLINHGQMLLLSLFQQSTGQPQKMFLVTPILDGKTLLYSFVSTVEVRIGISFGSGSSQSTTEFPGVSPWLLMGRSSPNDKILLVQALLKGGEVVAVRLQYLRELDPQKNEVDDHKGQWLSYFLENCTSLIALNFACLKGEINVGALERLVARSPNLKSLRLNRYVLAGVLQRILM